VLAIGNPFGVGQTVTSGIVSALARTQVGINDLNFFIQTDAAINPGNSGGPLIDLQGRVIGINTAIASNGGGNEGIGFSIPSNLVRWVVEQLLRHGHVQRAYLGVTLDPDFDEEKAALLHLDRVRGAYILEVHPNTPASRANLKRGDLIISFNGIDVQDENHLINLVSLSPVGKTVQLVILRDGKKLTIDVVLAARSLDQQTSLPSRPGMGTPVEPMGLTLYPLTPALAEQLGYDPNRSGLLVLKVDDDSPLRGEIRLYDLIEEVARQPVHSLQELRRRLESSGSDQTLVIKVGRRINGKMQQQLVVWRLP